MAAAFAAAGALGCGDAVAPAAALVTGEYGITDIAVDDNFVYFVTKGGMLKKVSIDGGSVETLASGLTDPRRIAVDKMDVYSVTSTGTLVRVAKRGGDLVTLAEGAEIDAPGLVLDDAYAYFTVKGDDKLGAVRKVAKADGAEVADLASNQSNPGALALRHGHLYWSVDDALMEMPAAGGTPQVFMPDQDKPISVASDDTYVYWANLGDGVVGRASVDGSDPLLVAKDLVNPYQVAGDSVNVFWTSLDGTLSTAPVGGEVEPAVLSSGPQGPIRLALDATSIYWANFEAGTVIVRPKP
ncbi:MAG: hypothetical protein IT372_15675 [Polyangiaceae bacterium]|nr:hypothetical protein [Polyangiaceae bacterium]